MLPRIVQEESRHGARLGYARPSYETWLQRSHDFFVSLAPDLNAQWEDLKREAEAGARPAELRRIERRGADEAAAELIAVIRSLPQPVREVLELRAAGLSWRDISHELPGRVMFSIMADYDRGLRDLEERHADLLARLV